MKKTLSLLIVLLAAAAVATLTFAGEPGKLEHHVKLMLNAGDEPIEIETEGLAVGESREFQTESGKAVVLTRTEDGLEVTVDGKKLDLPGHGGAHAFFHGGEETKIFVAHTGEGEEGEHRFVWVDGEGHGAAGHGEGHHVVKIHRHHPDAAKRLQASGVLDGLDAPTRERILEELRKIDTERAVEMTQKVIVRGGDETEE